MSDCPMSEMGDKLTSVACLTLVASSPGSRHCGVLSEGQLRATSGHDRHGRCASRRWAQWVPNTISHHLALGTGRRKLSPNYLGGVPWPASASRVGSLPFWPPMLLATAD